MYMSFLPIHQTSFISNFSILYVIQYLSSLIADVIIKVTQRKMGMRQNTHVCIYTCLQLHAQHAWICTCTYMYTHMQIRMNKSPTCMYMLAHMHTCTPTHRASPHIHVHVLVHNTQSTQKLTSVVAESSRIL